MKELHIQGWLCYDYDDLLAVKNHKTDKDIYASSIQTLIEDFLSKKVEYYYDIGLGGKRTLIPNVSIRMYATNKACNIDEAMSAVVAHLDGDLYSDIGYEGYSEWTVTGYYCKEFRVGNHDLAKELNRHIGKYIHLVIEYKGAV